MDCISIPPANLTAVMAGLVPAIHVGRRRAWLQEVNQFPREGDRQTIKSCYLPDGVDGRDKPGHDGGERWTLNQPILFGSRRRAWLAMTASRLTA